MSHVVITGAQGGQTQGAVAPNRLEINDLIKNQDLFSLYIQALTALFETSQSNQLSHFGVGGIHGLPYVQWEGSGGTSPVHGSQWGGYCTHGSVLFPTWHRPYVALYEQLLQQNALNIAKQYQDQQRWLGAAQNLRAPYWDWATNSVPPPEVISLQTVDIITPDGNTTTVQNPLLQYPFHPIDPSFPAPYSYWQTTIRHPDNPGSPDATTDSDALAQELGSLQNDITTSTYNLLTRVNTWPAFSNHTPGDGGSSSNSLEAIHDEIHGIVGGQMGDPAVAVNPGVWVSKGPAEGGTFTIPGNASSTPILASRLSGIAVKVLDFVANHSDWKSSRRNQSIHRHQYGGGGGSFSAQSLLAQSPAADSAQAPLGGSAPVREAVSAVKPEYGKEPPKVIYDWTSRIHFKKYELGTSFAVLIFLGEVPEDPAQWRTCRSFADVVAEGFVHLNSAIAARSGLSSYEPHVVTPYLKDNLHWRVQAGDRTAVEISRLSSLEVTISATT
ncbi:common central domain of tyrosinase-domain-containing protein [Russula vinacea]|nr:common central domain of tyrosinase-domain-containing protein [Russula vinacea]